MKKITITQKDIEKAGIQNSDSGYLIDELAYSAKQWTSDDLYINNTEYEPQTPYGFNYEDDLLANTKTWGMLNNISSQLGEFIIPSLLEVSKSKLQAGAFMALKYSAKWDELLTAYTEKLKEDGVDSISENYNKALQEEIDEYQNEQYKEWLNGDRDFRGVIYEISKYFTSNAEGSYDEKLNEYTFCLDEEDIENFIDMGYKKNQMKRALLNHIKTASNRRSEEEKQKQEKRKLEYEKTKAYKEEQEKIEKQERKAKLEAMTL